MGDESRKRMTINIMGVDYQILTDDDAQRVRVEVFSKIKAMFLPFNLCCSIPAYLAALRSLANFKKKTNSSLVKSSSLRK